MKLSNFIPLLQLKTLIYSLDTEQYTGKLKVLNGSTIGQHARHIVEFYQCLQRGLDCGFVDYDARERQLIIEQSIAYTLAVIDDVVATFESADKSTVITLSSEEELFDTSLGRELLYLNEHTVHHLAIIRIGIQESFEDIIFDQQLGVAESTIKYRAEQLTME